MSLLTGFSSPSYRTLDSHQSQNAEIAGYQLLGDAFNAPHADPNSHPSQHESLKSQAPNFGITKSTVEQANLIDPRHEVAGVSHKAQGQIHNTKGKVASGEQAITAHHEQNLKGVDQESKQGFAEVGQIKAEHFRAAIASAANNMPSVAEASYNYLGGSLYNSAKNIEALGTVGNQGAKDFINSAREAYSKGNDFWDAIKFGASESYSGFLETTQRWADQRVNEVADKLTLSQQAFYRASMFEAFAGIAVGGEYSGSLGDAKQQLIEDEGYTDGNNIAKLLISAAGQNRMDLIDQIGNFNRARGRINY
jgi:conjugal transfer mating pair stabilization protein TraG